MIHAKPRQKLGIERKQFIHFNLMVWEDAREKLKRLLKAQFKHKISKNNKMAQSFHKFVI